VSVPENENGRKPPDDSQKTVISPQRRPDDIVPERSPPVDPDATQICPLPPPGGRDASDDDPERTEIWDAPAPDSGDTADDDPERTEIWDPPEQHGATPVGASGPSATPPPAATGRAAERPQTPIQVGDCLNHIYEVKRFIARGGMGEVFEGVNITSDERVAIKVMLPSLAADPNVIAMFRREARSMTRLQHEALVQYRVLAQEPQLGILYIVTEFIDGTPLCDVLGTLRPAPDQLEMLLRRLASGLRAAHRLDVLHRDVSPDNVLLESGRIERAKIVDFGIAKDLTPGAGTIIGEGFAGKLGYVAPEQLGDFNREVGPWTDVYSLGLVIAAVAAGRDLQMGGTLVDAVDRRRKGPDLSSVPESLRPVLAAMLQPNPVERLRSMDDVLAMLDARHTKASTATGSIEKAQQKLPRWAPIAGGAAAILLLGGLAVLLTSGPDEPGPGESGQGQSTSRQPNAIAAKDPVDTARSAINSIIPSIGCSWLDIVRVQGSSRDLSVVMRGVAGDPSAAQSEVASALAGAGLPNADIDAAAIAPIEPGGCSALDAYRQIRYTGAPRLSTKQLVWDRHLMKSGFYKGQQAAQPIITIDIGDPKLDLTLIGIAPSGLIEGLLSSRASLESKVGGMDSDIVKLPGGAYQIKMDIDHQGWSGLILITGKGPFEKELVIPQLGARNMAWRERIATVASQRGWKADMLWLKVEDQRTGD
jgi:serine/threonine-protein kinase